jgi:hypothetical protein
MRFVLFLATLVLGFGTLPGCSDKPTTGSATGGASNAATGATDAGAVRPGGGRMPKPR